MRGERPVFRWGKAEMIHYELIIDKVINIFH